MTADLVLAFDPTRRRNSTLMRDCARLGYLGGASDTVLDLTYGKGKFWTEVRPPGLITNDVDTSTLAAYNEDFRATGWPTGWVDYVVFDPPYRLGGTASVPAFDEAYGLAVAWRSRDAVRSLIVEGTQEAVRLARRLVLVKVQDQVNGGRVHSQVTWVINAAEQVGGRFVDSLHVVGGRGQPSGRRQVRARHGYSTLVVLEVR